MKRIWLSEKGFPGVLHFPRSSLGGRGEIRIFDGESVVILNEEMAKKLAEFILENLEEEKDD